MIRFHFVLAALSLATLLTAGGTAHAQRGGHGGAASHGSAHVSHGSAHISHGNVHSGHYNHNGHFHGGPFIGVGVGFYGYGYGYPYYYAPYYPPVVYPAYAYPPSAVIVQGQPATVAPVPDAPPATPQGTDNQPAPKNAQVKVVLPDPQAKVWFDGNPTKATGSERLFHTPDLAPGANNTYRIRASWIVNGKEVVQELAIPVLPGRMSVADFSRPASEGVAPPPPVK